MYRSPGPTPVEDGNCLFTSVVAGSADKLLSLGDSKALRLTRFAIQPRKVPLGSNFYSSCTRLEVFSKLPRQFDEVSGEQFRLLNWC